MFFTLQYFESFLEVTFYSFSCDKGTHFSLFLLTGTADGKAFRGQMTRPEKGLCSSRCVPKGKILLDPGVEKTLNKEILLPFISSWGLCSYKILSIFCPTEAMVMGTVGGMGGAKRGQ